MRKFSVIIPVYNRPDELTELLKSLELQSYRNFEVLVIEDGSSLSSNLVAERFKNTLDISYYYKDNSGPGQTRNFGVQKASGDYYVFFDSDCIIPPQYLATVNEVLDKNYTDAYGGPDKAHSSFTPVQKAINYSMTSFFTTGGIRGRKKQLDKFFPRSFNMGISQEVFDKTNGYSEMRFGEDIDLSLRIIETGFKTQLIPDAFVYHKRRTSLKKFYKQVYNSGIARINLYKRHPHSLKMVHLLPAVFVAGNVLLLLLSLWNIIFLLPLLLYILLIIADSFLLEKNILVALLSPVASYIQLFGYGLGFFHALDKRILRGEDEFSAFSKNFYK
ncbi:MAG: glycosyltransferase [Bacteroidota bacterium]|nr:glycosyltransferase [Bacteroidota bacterium]MDP4225683.1 glycosyltransferase [Bacteroidota bacterium]MDP4274547.1 glycosyltransferase [Bacteroidota bacterium]